MTSPGPRLTSIRCAKALTPSGWENNCVIELDQTGRIAAITNNNAGATDLSLNGIVIAGLPNLHSHAHQKAIAGLTEHRIAGQDDFWGWRDLMYRANAQLDPDQLQAVARYLYTGMLQSGYTSVAEFHYLHHQPGGDPYRDCSELSARLLEAASEVGIAITLLPVLYCRGGFNNDPVQDTQRRFANSPESYLKLLQACDSLCVGNPDRSVGFAAHSLRAVAPDVLSATLEDAGSLIKNAPVHIHVAEQTREVAECLALNGVRPVAWLYDQCDVTDQWCLIHATHVDSGELDCIVKSGATVGLCPTTEANLGDGIFPAAQFLTDGGRLGVGSDSQICTSPAEELRLLEYVQRLSLQRRTVMIPDDAGSNGRALITTAISGGARALGEKSSGLVSGARGDLIEIDHEHSEFASRTPDQILDSWIFSGPNNAVRNVIVGGRHVVRDGVHPLRESASGPFRQVIAMLNNA